MAERFRVELEDVLTTIEARPLASPIGLRLGDVNLAVLTLNHKAAIGSIDSMIMEESSGADDNFF